MPSFAGDCAYVLRISGWAEKLGAHKDGVYLYKDIISHGLWLCEKSRSLQGLLRMQNENWA